MDLPASKLTNTQHQFTRRMQSDVYFYSMIIIVGLIPVLLNGYIWSTNNQDRRYDYANVAYATLVGAIGAYHLYMSQTIDRQARQLLADAIASKSMPADVQASASKAIEAAYYPIRMRTEVLAGAAGLAVVASLVFSGKNVFVNKDHHP